MPPARQEENVNIGAKSVVYGDSGEMNQKPSNNFVFGGGNSGSSNSLLLPICDTQPLFATTNHLLQYFLMHCGLCHTPGWNL